MKKNELSENDKSVFAILKKNSKPLTAYDVLDKLKGSKIKAPQTVYRSLDALSEKGLIHRIQSLGAFVACHNDEEDHGTQFAVCRDCKDVIELHDHRICNVIHEISSKIKFNIEREFLEMIGLCDTCAHKA
jgi:Fur family zinc uptake transcriptional regulator